MKNIFFKLKKKKNLERKKNNIAQNELNKFKEENTQLTIDLQDVTHRIELLNKKTDTNELTQKQRDIEILKAELRKYEDENRGLKDHVNYVLTQNAQFKEETDQIVNLIIGGKNNNKLIFRLMH